MTSRQPSQEVRFPAVSGWAVVASQFVYAGLVVFTGVAAGNQADNPPYILFCIFSALLVVFLCAGYFIVPPNKARALVLFGRYRGTVRENGFYWTNPFTAKLKVSLKAHNISSQKIKVNDLVGNPIEIGAVVVWQVNDSAQALFDVENFEQYVDVQIETAIRHLASTHPYDESQATGGTVSLRGGTDELAVELKDELQRRLDRAGIGVIEARISHLAYAPEIASAMLQRQQAAAVIAARRLIVEGAVGMVEHALDELGSKHILELDDERRATLVGNLLVVLCSHSAPTPVLNTGSLYT